MKVSRLVVAFMTVAMLVAQWQFADAEPVLKGGIDTSTGTSKVEVRQRKSGAFLTPLPLQSPTLRPLQLPQKLELPARAEAPALAPLPSNLDIDQHQMQLRLERTTRRLDEMDPTFDLPLTGIGGGEFIPLPTWTRRSTTINLDLPGVPADLVTKVHMKLMEQQALMQTGETTNVVLPPLPVTRLRHPLSHATSANILTWDEWYKHLSELLKDPLLDAMARNNAPTGSNTIRVTVTAQHKLTIAVEKSGGPEFDTAIIEAYSSVDGNPQLAFPQGSLRPRVTFLTDHRHTSDAPVDDVTVFTLKGDQESVFNY